MDDCVFCEIVKGSKIPGDKCPEHRPMPRARVARRLREYLDTEARMTLWGRAIDVSHPEGRGAAVRMVMDLLEAAGVVERIDD